MYLITATLFVFSLFGQFVLQLKFEFKDEAYWWDFHMALKLFFPVASKAGKKEWPALWWSVNTAYVLFVLLAVVEVFV